MKVSRKRQQGFSLTELVVGLAVVGILSEVALPAYKDSVREGRRADGQAAALRLQLAMEDIRTSCSLYPQTLGAGDDCDERTVEFSASSEQGHYNLAINGASGNNYTIVIDPVGNQAADTDCDPMTLGRDGSRSPAQCWE